MSIHEERMILIRAYGLTIDCRVMLGLVRDSTCGGFHKRRGDTYTTKGRGAKLKRPAHHRGKQRSKAK